MGIIAISGIIMGLYMPDMPTILNMEIPRLAIMVKAWIFPIFSIISPV